ncbi:PH domain-containing protein [Mycolicibacterium sp. XJ870]
MEHVSARSATGPVVIRISPMAHLAVGFFAFGLLTVVFTNPAWLAPLLVIPIVLALAIVRYRTVADQDTVTARSLLGSETVPWNEIEGLRFDRASWALAHRTDGSDLRLPAVTFSTLPLLSEVSGGRVPNPYA